MANPNDVTYTATEFKRNGKYREGKIICFCERGIGEVYIEDALTIDEASQVKAKWDNPSLPELVAPDWPTLKTAIENQIFNRNT